MDPERWTALHQEAIALGQLSLLSSTDQEWSNDDWETPSHLAAEMAALIEPWETRILEPSAGTGQIVRRIIDRRKSSAIITTIEPNYERFKQLPMAHEVWNHCITLQSFHAEVWSGQAYDLVITNPPFSFGIEFLELSLRMISANGRVLFLLPSDYFQAQSRALQFQRLGGCITRMWPIAGRVGYLKNGVAHNNRQCYDSIFEFKRGGDGAVNLVF